MNIFKPTVLAVSSMILGACSNPSNIEVGGVPGAVLNQPGKRSNSSHVVTRFDPTHIETPKPRGQVKFSVPIEKNFKPSPKSARALPVKKDEDPVPEALRNFRTRSASH